MEREGPSRLAISEWIGIACGAVLVVSLFTLPWFGFSLDGEVVPGSTGDAFRWIHGLDLALLVTGLVALGAALMRFLGPPRPGSLLIGIVAGTVASFLIGALMISPPEGGEATYGALSGNPPGELVPQRGSLVGLSAALGSIVTGWIGIGRLMEEVAAAETSQEIAPVPLAPRVPVIEPAPVTVATPPSPSKPKRSKPKAAKSSTTRPKATKPRASKPKAPATKTKTEAAAPKKRTTTGKPKTTRARKPPVA